jgi:hypothetical protein
VDRGSVIESSTLLPLSYLGCGLDLMHSVLGMKKIASLKFAAELEVEDAKLVSAVPQSSALRTLGHAVNLISFVPRQIVQSLVGGRKQRKSQVDPDRQQNIFDPTKVSDAVPQDRQALTPSVAGMRRYGNQ